MTSDPRPPARGTAREIIVVAALAILFLGVVKLNLWIASLPEVAFVKNDISYYGFHLNDMFANGKAGVMPEYPMPAVWLLGLIYLAGGGWQTWEATFAAIMIVLTGIVAWSVYRRGNPRATLFWLAFAGASGPIIWFRFDLVPAALVVWACVWLSTRPRVAGALVALGAAVKLWPALFALPMAAPRPLGPTRGRRRAVSFLVAGFLLGMSSLLLAGWDRSVAPLVWQRERGLQMESVPATPLMFLRTFTELPSWELFLSDFNAIELRGPGVDAMLTLSTVLTLASIALTAALTWRLLRAFRQDSDAVEHAILWSLLAILLATVVANKTLSPQYVPWFAGPVAALLLVRGRPDTGRHVVVQALGLVWVAGLTQFTYPWGTMQIMAGPNSSPFETSVLILRNLLLVGLAVHAGLLAWRLTGARKDSGVKAPTDSVSFTTDGTAA